MDGNQQWLETYGNWNSGFACLQNTNDGGFILELKRYSKHTVPVELYFL